MILFLYGEDTYRARRKLAAIKRKFLEKYPSDNLAQPDVSQLTSAQLKSVLLAQTLLGGSRLVILEGLLALPASETKTTLAELVKAGLPDEVTVIVFETTDFDKRQTLFRLLNKPGQTECFTTLKGVALHREVQMLATERQLALKPAMVEYLIMRAGNDLWRLGNELNKLSAYADGQPVTSMMIDELVGESLESDIFQLVTAALSHQAGPAHQILTNRLAAGDDEIRMMGAVAHQLRNLIRISDLRAAGLSPQEGIRLTKLPPFVVQANWQSATRFSREQLMSAYRGLAATDWKIKTGASRPTDALELFTLSLYLT